jgi:hypothetical protein
MHTQIKVGEVGYKAAAKIINCDTSNLRMHGLWLQSIKFTLKRLIHNRNGNIQGNI